MITPCILAHRSALARVSLRGGWPKAQRPDPQGSPWRTSRTVRVWAGWMLLWAVCATACADNEVAAVEKLCESPCVDGATCVQGTCICASGSPPCSTGCVDISTDPSNCGGCDNACGAGESCVAGQCGCAQGYVTCPSAGCVDILSDSLHCGDCNHGCPPGGSCFAGGCFGPCPQGRKPCFGQCVITDTLMNCGECGVSCGRGAVGCVDGKCTGPSEETYCTCLPGEPNCADGCTDTQRDPRNCGGCRNLCLPPAPCLNGQCGPPP